MVLDFDPAVMLMPESSSEMHELRYRDRQQHQKPSSQIFVNNIDVGVAKIFRFKFRWSTV